MRPDIKVDLKERIEEVKAHCEREIARITEEAEREDKNRANFTTADDLHNLYCNLQNAGFDAQQAWELIKIMVSKAM